MQSSGITDTHGQSHQQCNSQTGCGIEFYVDGKRWELEGGELVLCPEAAQSTQIHKVKGIPAQIISKLNQKYCGKVYIDGGELADVPEKNFDIEKIAVVDELKPHSLVINKKNSLSNTCFELEGTPRQIASYLNEYNNHGDSFRWDERTANVINILENGGEIITTIDSSDPGRYMKLYLMSKKAGKGTEISETKSPSAHQSISPSTYQPSNTIHELFKGTMTAEKFRQMHGIEKKEEQPNELSRQLHEKGIIKDPANRVKNKFKELKNILLQYQTPAPKIKHINSAGFAIFYKDKILLAHPTNAAWYKTYSIPKGMIDDGESPIDAATRETKEEVGITIPAELITKKTIDFQAISDQSKKGLQRTITAFPLRINSLSDIGLPDLPESNTGTITLPKTMLQLNEVDWAGFIPIREAKKRIHDQQWQFLFLNELPLLEKEIKKTLYRAEGMPTEKAGDDFIFYGEKETAEEYAAMWPGTKVIKSEVSYSNPLEVTLEFEQFSDPKFEKPYLQKAKNNGNDAVIFTNKETGEKHYAIKRKFETKSILNQETDLKGDKKQSHHMSLSEFLKKERRSKGKEAVNNLPELFKEHYKKAIEHAIEKGWYGEDIIAGRITANDAKTIIENAGIIVPTVIWAMTEKNLHSGGEVAPAIEIENPTRWQKKKEHIQEIANNIQRLRLNVTNDLKSNDQKIFLTALVVALMDKTGERVGNEDSASNGHFGITGLQKDHISFSGNKVILNYTGKSGVDHEKEFTDIKLLKYLKKAIRKSPDKFVFVTTDGFKIKADTVNRYLIDFNVTTKDIRGYSANKWIIDKLNCLEEIPSEENKRKREFNAIVKKIAQKIGHGSGTLKKHYLIPELAEQFIIHGKIIDIKNLGYTMDKGGEIPGIKSKLQTLYSILKSEYQSQLSKGIAVEQEHKETLEKVDSGKISIPEAIKETASEHIKEDHYSKLEQIEKGELSDNEKNFVKKLFEDIIAGVQYNNPRLEKAANEFNITDRRIIKELAELSIVIHARKIANE